MPKTVYLQGHFQNDGT